MKQKTYGFRHDKRQPDGQKWDKTRRAVLCRWHSSRFTVQYRSSTLHLSQMQQGNFGTRFTINLNLTVWYANCSQSCKRENIFKIPKDYVFDAGDRKIRAVNFGIAELMLVPKSEESKCLPAVDKKLVYWLKFTKYSCFLVNIDKNWINVLEESYVIKILNNNRKSRK